VLCRARGCFRCARTSTSAVAIHRESFGARGNLALPHDAGGHEVNLHPYLIDSKACGSPAWIRTTIHGSKGRCPTIRRPGKIRKIQKLSHSVAFSSALSQRHSRNPRNLPGKSPLQWLRKAIWTGVRDGLQNRSAAVEAAGVFDSHCLPPELYTLFSYGYRSISFVRGNTGAISGKITSCPSTIG
jgi:hypothetical protein